MKIKEILKKAGAGLVRDLVPGGSLIIDIINDVLPEDKKLPTSATGEQASHVIDSLDVETRFNLLEKQLDVDLATTQAKAETLQTMLEADAKTTHTTRPKIALQAFYVVGVCTVLIVGSWCGAMWLNRPDIVETIQHAGPFVGFLLGPLVFMLHAYFGILRHEQSDKLNAMTGQPANSGSLARYLTRIKNK